MTNPVQAPTQDELDYAWAWFQTRTKGGNLGEYLDVADRASHNIRRELQANALRDAAQELEANAVTLFADQIPESEHWVAQRLGSYGESAWLRDRADKIESDGTTR